ncbi:hypothetical protein MPTK1_5g09200 [Marchantia polymorpha subsp. ruderalis]|uniref:Uncharacterized protein n=2 Tax=Marchantia polymorpha TaxID=3197 RepID=A0AAF6BGI3_MARPO|nr:hypothetical protein MARPO_0095s0039 [Marchantia polymorpha]BBN11117.1 hypothetical protein Mp_5g09200 [Marchantia polymorpha subsp. ruderalis]|eukprot:PTQ32780.1 hypothetical protein MARPO_0095s0039 [Marchantia polymorpha]
MRGCGGHGGHCGHHHHHHQQRQQRNIVITTNFDNDDNERDRDGDPEETAPAPRVHESCIGTNCSRSPSPIRREFWESNKPLPDIVIRKREQALRNKQLPEENETNAAPRVIVRQGRPRCRGRQSRDPLFVYNEASESGTCCNGSSNSVEINVRSNHHTPEPRRPRSNHASPGRGNLTLDVDEPAGCDESTQGCRMVTVKNNSGPNSPRSVKFSLNETTPRVVVNDCASLCCPTVEHRSCSPSPCPPCHYQDRACSPIPSRSQSPCLKRSRSHSRSSSRGSVELHSDERCVTVDQDDDGSVSIQISSSEDNSPTASCAPCPPCPEECCGSPCRTPTPCSRSRSPTCRSSDQNSVEISSDDGDVQVEWQGGNDVSLQVDLENSDECSTPRRVNVRCSRSNSPPHCKSKSRSRSRSRSGSPRSRPPWDNTTLPCGKGALRLDRPPPPISKSRSPSRSPSRSRSHTPKSRTPRSIEIHSSDESQSCVKIDWGYQSESVDSHSTSGSPQRRVCYTPCRSRCSSPSTSRRSTSRSRSSSPSGVRSRCIDIQDSTPDGPQVTIHREYLSSTEGSCRSEATCTPRVPACTSRPATAPHCGAMITCASPPVCIKPLSLCHPREHVTNCCCNSCSCFCNSACDSVSVVSSGCHGGRHHSVINCNHCHQLPSHCTCSVSVSSISSSSCLPCPCSVSSCMRSYVPCHHHHHVPKPEPVCSQFCPAAGDIVIRAHQRHQVCPHSEKDDGQVEFFSHDHNFACGLREGDTIVRLGKFDSSGRWCASDIVGMYMLGSHGLWIFLGEEEGHECLKPLQADQHQIVRTINKWLRPRLGDLIIHPLPGPRSFYFWNPKKRLECDDTRLLLRAFIGPSHVVDDSHDLACCSTSHLPVGQAELYVNVRKHWLFLGRDDHMFTQCEIKGS